MSRRLPTSINNSTLSGKLIEWEVEVSRKGTAYGRGILLVEHERELDVGRFPIFAFGERMVPQLEAEVGKHVVVQGRRRTHGRTDPDGAHPPMELEVSVVVACGGEE